MYEGFVGQQDFPWDQGTRRAALLSGCEGVPVLGEDAELRAKLDLRRRLTESGVKKGLRMAEDVEEGWLMALILAARSSEAALEAALAASKASRSWAAISRPRGSRRQGGQSSGTPAAPRGFLPGLPTPPALRTRHRTCRC